MPGPTINIYKTHTELFGLFERNPVRFHMTYINAFVTNLFNGVRSDLPKRCIVDTGAAITILNRDFNSIFADKRTPVIDRATIQYGGGNSPSLPVYEVEVMIEGKTWKILAAHNEHMALDTLLGHHCFLNDLDAFNVRGKRRDFRLIKS